MKVLKNRVAELVAKRGRLEGRRITQAEVAEATGIAIQTVNRYMLNRVGRYDGDVVIRFCDWLDCEVGDLLVAENAGQLGPEMTTPMLATA